MIWSVISAVAGVPPPSSSAVRSGELLRGEMSSPTSVRSLSVRLESSDWSPPVPWQPEEEESQWSLS